MRVNIYGRDPKTGFARKPQDNVGRVRPEGRMTGLLPSMIFSAQRQVGGNDIDGNFVKKAFGGRSGGADGGLFVGADQHVQDLNMVPMLHYRSYTDTTTPGDIHDRHRDLTIAPDWEKATGSSATRRSGWRPCAGAGQSAAVNRRADRAGYDDEMARCDGGRSGAADAEKS